MPSARRTPENSRGSRREESQTNLRYWIYDLRCRFQFTEPAQIAYRKSKTVDSAPRTPNSALVAADVSLLELSLFQNDRTHVQRCNRRKHPLAQVGPNSALRTPNSALDSCYISAPNPHFTRPKPRAPRPAPLINPLKTLAKSVSIRVNPWLNGRPEKMFKKTSKNI